MNPTMAAAVREGHRAGACGTGREREDRGLVPGQVDWKFSNTPKPVNSIATTAN